jgi:carbamoyltransferase
MKILGISAFYHDSAAAILVDGQIVAAAQEERFTRIKHDPSFPTKACEFCLAQAGISLDDLDAVVFYDKPFLKFERLLETYYTFSPKGLPSFIKGVPIWVKEKVFLKRLIRKELAELQQYDKKKLKLLFPEHHLSHMASAFYPSPFEDAAIVTLDGVGEWATCSIAHGKRAGIETLKELKFPHSIGLLYSSFTYWLGFKVNSGEYKLMGLAPYGNPDSENVARFVDVIKSTLVDIEEDGSIWLNQAYFNYAAGLRMANDKKWEQLFGFPRKTGEDELKQVHCDLAFAIQAVTEEIVIKIAQEAKRLTGSKNLCLAGGVALNCVANGKLLRAGIFEHIFIQPAAGDAGGALGAALAAYHIYFEQARAVTTEADALSGSYLGPEFSADEIEELAKVYDAKFTKQDSFDATAEQTAGLLSEGNVIGWFQGRMEFGPRSLGNRSILGDARNREMQEKLNLKIKYRESFRPFAPSVLLADAKEYFELETPSPYMLLVAEIADKRKADLPENYNALPLMERLYVERSDVPSITHVDFSARVQTVAPETNKRYWDLITKFKEKTGYGLVVNTSFNVRGEPIVCTPDDAYRCFMRTEMDFLVLGDYIFAKTEQPAWDQKDAWQEEFALD